MGKVVCSNLPNLQARNWSVQYLGGETYALPAEGHTGKNSRQRKHIK